MFRWIGWDEPRCESRSDQDIHTVRHDVKTIEHARVILIWEDNKSHSGPGALARRYYLPPATLALDYH